MKKLIILIFIILQGGFLMANEKPCFVDKVIMVSNQDLGHGGESKKYQIIHVKDYYEINLTISRHFPRPGEENFKPSKKIIHITKTSEEIDNLLDILTKEIKMFKLSNLETKILLHPSFYDFRISNSCSELNKFTYVIEGSHHTDEKYEKLVNVIISFFEK
jgi:hypothetical protein